LPAWLDDATWLIDAACSSPAVTDGPALPFGACLQPMAAAMARRITVTASARAGLERAFASELRALCAPALLAAFTAMRGPAPDTTTTDAYDRFVGELRAGGLWPFFHERPVLARLLATYAAGAVTATSELLRRFETDRADIEREIVGASLGAITGIDI